MSMVNLLKWASFALLATVLLAQAIRFDHTNPPVSADISAPPEVVGPMQRACYDCHSNETRWPWYAEVAPVSWLVARDVDEGRREVNFSAWDTYATKKLRNKLKECAEEIDEGEMPPWYYTLVHSEARLSATEKAALRQWFASEREKLPKGD
jgi:inorganic triphosphatase YgiF